MNIHPSDDINSAISFVPRPPNDFAEFIETYYDECRAQAPQIEAIAAKWTFEDLIPGLSDFDTRFICTNTMTAEDWCKMSTAIGQVHLDLCRQHPKWARILEHLPGVNLTWAELTSEETYYPEYKQWTCYDSTEPERLTQAQDSLANREWDSKDEYFHLKKFLTYYGPYNRSIDPAINLGPYEHKYPLHSRLMHYFTPPLQAAVSIIQRQSVAGKMETLRLAKSMFPELSIINEITETVAQHYEVPHLYEEPAISELEARLFEALKRIGERLSEEITILPSADRTTPEDWQTSLKQIPVAPSLAIFDYAKFTRLMKGRFYFYTQAPAHFATVLLIQNELNRIGTWFFRIPFGIFCETVHGQRPDDPAKIVPHLVPEVITEEEARCTIRFDELTNGEWRGRELEVAEQIVDVFDGFFRALDKITREVRALEQD